MTQAVVQEITRGRRSSRRLCVMGFVGLCCIGPVWSQTSTPQTLPATSTTDPQSNQYKVAPDDLLSITVQGQPDLSRKVQVLQDGTIDLPSAGQIKVVGLTIGQLKQEVTRRLAKTLVRPQVNVNVEGRQVKLANVVGSVKTPGRIPLREGYRLLDVLAAAGIESDRFEFYRASLFQDRTKQTIPIDLQKLIGEKDPAANLPVEENDTITVTTVDVAEQTVQVIGQVNKPGPVLLPRNGSIVDVMQSAGGPATGARLSQVTLERRDGQRTIIDMRDYQKTGFETKETLRAGDRLIVPENKLRFNVYGAVGRPGELPYPDDRKLTVFSAIAYAGGQTNGAELKKTRLTRVNPDGTAKSSEVVNVDKMLKTGDLNGDVPVEPGDSIYVPASTGRKGIDPFALIGVVGAIPVLYGIFTGRIFR